MRQTLQFFGLAACGLLLAAMGILVFAAIGGPGGTGLGGATGARSAAGIDYVSFAIGLTAGLVLSRIAGISWADLPQRAVEWIIDNRRNAKYFAYACVSIAVLIFV